MLRRAPPKPTTPVGLLRRLARRWYLVPALLGAVILAVPAGMLALGTARARACVAGYAAPRGAALPDCRAELRWFFLPAHAPWTATPARYRAEELTLRAAIAAYDDAAIGHPDGEALPRAAVALSTAEELVSAGSQRRSLEELGRGVGAPDLGRSAMLLGDRRTLLGRSDEWAHFSVRLRALDAALLEGDVARASALARRYAEFDPRDEELRTAIAAMLCLGEDERRGVELLVTVQRDRATGRHESWARNWGEVRAMLVACAAKGGLPAPPLPERSNGGTNDLPEVRAALQLRLPAPEGELEGFQHIIELLRGPVAAGARVHLVAALLAAGRPVSPSLAVELSTPRTNEGEPPLDLPSPADLTAVEWLAHGRAMRARATPSALRGGARALQRMSEDGRLPEAETRTLVSAAAVTAVEAVRALALAGAPAAAVELAGETRALLGCTAKGLLASSAWFVAGEPARALEAMEARRCDGDKTSPAWLLQRAELLASLGRRDEAAVQAVAADDAAAHGGERPLDVRAQWTRLALAGSRRSKTAPLGGRAWPWVGPMATPSSWLGTPAESPDALAQALAFWDGALRASPEERRAIRYAAVARHSGDTPRARAMYLSLAGGLLRPGEGDVEAWLDAFSATAVRSTTLRGYAWDRALAARLRGDAAAAERWAVRYATLVKLSAPPDNQELAEALGI